MRKIFIAAAIICWWNIQVVGAIEYKSIGVKASVNHAGIDGTMSPWAIEQSQDPITSWSAGLYAVFSLRENLFLQPELLYSGRGFDEYRVVVTCAPTSFYWHHQYEYIDLPVLVKYRYYSIADKIYPTVFAGPCVSYFNKYYLQGYGGPGPDYSCEQSDHLMKRWEFSGIIGIGIDYKQVVMDVRYQRAFTEHRKFRDAKNEVWSLSLGVNL